MRGGAVSPDSEKLVLTGYDAVGSNENFKTTMLDARTGVQLWNQSWDNTLYGGLHDHPNAVTFGRDGSRVLVTGTSSGNGYATVSYDAATGAEQWVALAPSEISEGVAIGIATTPDGRLVYVAGESAGHFDVRAYDVITGLPAWIGRDPYFGIGVPYDLAVGPDGTAYVTGEGQVDMLTQAYAQ